ncbi:MAG: thioredoxin, partial [Planctomycetales bacterium]
MIMIPKPTGEKTMKRSRWMVVAVMLFVGCGGPTPTDQDGAEQPKRSAASANVDEPEKKTPEPVEPSGPPPRTTPFGVTENTFEEQVLNNPLPVLVAFWSADSEGCREMAPVLQEFAKEAAGKAVVAKMDVAKNRDSAAAYSADFAPTLVLIHQGEVAFHATGPQTLDELRAALDVMRSAARRIANPEDQPLKEASPAEAVRVVNGLGATVER